MGKRDHTRIGATAGAMIVAGALAACATPPGGDRRAAAEPVMAVMAVKDIKTEGLPPPVSLAPELTGVAPAAVKPPGPTPAAIKAAVAEPSPAKIIPLDGPPPVATPAKPPAVEPEAAPRFAEPGPPVRAAVATPAPMPAAAAAPEPAALAAALRPLLPCPPGTTGMWSGPDIIGQPVYVCRSPYQRR